MSFNSGLASANCPPLDTQTRHPCAGCDAPLSQAECAGYAFGGSRIAPLCRACYLEGQANPAHAKLVRRAVALGHTLPAIRQLFARGGLELPVTREECQRAAAVLRGLDAMESAQRTGPVQ